MSDILIFLSSRRQRGQSLVEFGLMVMILMWMLAGAVDFGIAFFDYVAIRDAAQEGAMYGSICPTGDIEARVRNSASPAPVNLTDSTSVQVPAPSFSTNSEGQPILTVTVVYYYPISMPLIGEITGSHIRLQASATSVILNTNNACP